MAKYKDLGPDHLLPRCEPKPFYDSMENGWIKLLETYRAYIGEHYQTDYESDPDFFLLMKPQYTVFLYQNREIELYCYPADSDSIKHQVHQFNTLGESRGFNRLPPYKQKEKINDLLGREDKPIERITFKYGFMAPAIVLNEDYTTEDPEDLINMGEIKGPDYAKLHGENARRYRKERFNLFGLEEIIHKVGSISFEYELGEAIAAYKNKLYLAAASVSGMALENVLKLAIVKHLGDDAIPEKMYINNYTVTLLKAGILNDERLGHRLKGFSAIRNWSSHTKTGTAWEKDAEDCFTLIKRLILLLF